jgi:alkylhydroperoxidase/carboxymuconolactone decarboxylase family protein YurZ
MHIIERFESPHIIGRYAPPDIKIATILIPISTTEEMMSKIPKRFVDFMKSYPKIAEAYENLSEECRESGPLNQRERLLVKLGMAIGSGVEGSVRSQVRKSLDAGLTGEEIHHAFLLSIITIGFPNMMAALTWADDILGREQ